jgi:hypothetical protein
MSGAPKTCFPLYWLVLFAACTAGDELAAAAGHRSRDAAIDAAQYDATEPMCLPAQAAVAVVLESEGRGSSGPATWLWAADGVLAVAPNADGHGYQISRFASAGEPRGPSWTAFPDSAAQMSIKVAADGGLLAIAEPAAQVEPATGNQRRSCRLGLVRLQDETLVQAPTRVSTRCQPRTLPRPWASPSPQTWPWPFPSRGNSKRTRSCTQPAPAAAVPVARNGSLC